MEGLAARLSVKVSGSQFQFPPPWQVEEKMREFSAWLHQTHEHPVLKAAEAHLRLVTIRPFVDGNGRTARLLMNLLLMQAGYPPAIIRPARRQEYIESLIEAQTQQRPDTFLNLMADCALESLEMVLHHSQTEPN
jgi:Fic family protein